MDIVLTPPQTKFFSDITSKYIALVSGFGGGKTQTALTRMIKNMLDQQGLHQAYLAPTYSLIRDIWYPKVEEFLTELGLSFKINTTNHVIDITGLGKIYCRTMDKPETIIGWEVADAFLDEFDVLAVDKATHVFRKISARLRLENPHRPNQLFVTTTPEGFKATYQLFKKDPLANSRLIQMSTYSNEMNLPDGYIQGLRDQYPDQLIEAYLMGEFVNLVSGSVYYFDLDKNNTSVVHDKYEPIHVGMDFNVRNMSAIICVIRDGKMHAVGEFANVLDTPTMIDYIKDRYHGSSAVIYPDTSGNNTTSKSASVSDLSLLKKAGFRVDAPNRNPFIKDRVNSVNGVLEHNKFKVNVEKCPQLSDALMQQVYDKNGKPEKSPDNNIDDMCDAVGYIIHRKMPIKTNIMRERTLYAVS